MEGRRACERRSETAGRPFDSARVSCREPRPKRRDLPLKQPVCVSSFPLFLFSFFLLQVSTRLPTRQSKWRQISSRERDLPFRGPGSREQSRCRQPSWSVSAWTANYILDSAVPPRREVQLRCSDGLDKTIVRTIVRIPSHPVELLALHFRAGPRQTSPVHRERLGTAPSARHDMPEAAVQHGMDFGMLKFGRVHRAHKNAKLWPRVSPSRDI